MSSDEKTPPPDMPPRITDAEWEALLRAEVRAQALTEWLAEKRRQREGSGIPDPGALT
jgi:hypothetical protein